MNGWYLSDDEGFFTYGYLSKVDKECTVKRSIKEYNDTMKKCYEDRWVVGEYKGCFFHEMMTGQPVDPEEEPAEYTLLIPSRYSHTRGRDGA